MEAELELVQARLIEVKAMEKGLSPDSRLRLTKRVDDLEYRIDGIKAKLKELGEADEHTWEDLKDGIEHIWGALQSALQDTITNFKD